MTREITQLDSHRSVVDFLQRKIPLIIGQVSVDGYLHTEFKNSVAFFLESKFSPQIIQLFEWTMNSGQPIFYEPENIEANPDHTYYMDSGSAFVAPIIGSHQTFGVIQIKSLDKTRWFDEGDMLVARTVANSAALALIHLHEKELREFKQLQPLVGAVEARIPTHLSHSERVVTNAEQLARQLCLDDEACETIYRAAALHDIGMVHLSDDAIALLALPPTKQIAKQRQLLDSWTRLGSHLLEQVGISNAVSSIVFNQAKLYLEATWVNVDRDAPTEEAAAISFAKKPGMEPLPGYRNTAVRTSSDSHTYSLTLLHSQLREHRGTLSKNRQRDAPLPKQNKVEPCFILGQSDIAQNNIQSLCLSEIDSRIIAVADAFDNWLCWPATNQEPLNEHLAYLQKYAGMLFDFKVVFAFLSLIE